MPVRKVKTKPEAVTAMPNAATPARAQDAATPEGRGQVGAAAPSILGATTGAKVAPDPGTPLVMSAEDLAGNPLADAFNAFMAIIEGDLAIRTPEPPSATANTKPLVFDCCRIVADDNLRGVAITSPPDGETWLVTDAGAPDRDIGEMMAYADDGIAPPAASMAPLSPENVEALSHLRTTGKALDAERKGRISLTGGAGAPAPSDAPLTPPELSTFLRLNWTMDDYARLPNVVMRRVVDFHLGADAWRVTPDGDEIEPIPAPEPPPSPDALIAACLADPRAALAVYLAVAADHPMLALPWVSEDRRRLLKTPTGRVLAEVYPVDDVKYGVRLFDSGHIADGLLEDVKRQAAAYVVSRGAVML